MSSLNMYLLVALGGAFGAMLRFFISEVVLLSLGRGFPYATLLVNIVGSFIMGLLYAAISNEYVMIIPWRTMIGIGFLGALTTFSTFSLDTLLMLQQGEWFKAAANIALNVMLCLFGAWLGMMVISPRS